MSNRRSRVREDDLQMEIKLTIKNMLIGILAIFVAALPGFAQRADVTISLDEAFFDAFLDAGYQNFGAPEVAISARDDSACREKIKILRESDGVRTAVRFREGKIFVPLAFSGSYAPPFVGCVDFAGWAEANLDLEFDRSGQRLLGRVRVLNVNLTGTRGVGGTVIAKLLQRSVDSKLNPIEIMRLDKLSFAVPVQNGGNLRMKAVSVRPEIGVGSLSVHIGYEFVK